MPAIDNLLRDMKSDPAIAEEIRQNPEKVLREYKDPLQTDAWIYRLVVLALGITILSIVIGSLMVLYKNEKIQSDNMITIIASIGSAAIGAMAGLLAPSPRSANA